MQINFEPALNDPCATLSQAFPRYVFGMPNESMLKVRIHKIGMDNVFEEISLTSHLKQQNKNSY